MEIKLFEKKRANEFDRRDRFGRVHRSDFIWRFSPKQDRLAKFTTKTFIDISYGQRTRIEISLRTRSREVGHFAYREICCEAVRSNRETRR